MRVVFDTNIWVSGSLSSEGVPANLVDRAVAGEFFVYSSPPLYRELAEVMWRDAIRELVEEDSRKAYLSQIGSVMIVVDPEQTLDEIQQDPADNRVLECGLEANAEVIVTGDSHLLDLTEFRGILIQEPRTFLDEHRRGFLEPLFPDLT